MIYPGKSPNVQTLLCGFCKAMFDGSCLSMLGKQIAMSNSNSYSFSQQVLHTSTVDKKFLILIDLECFNQSDMNVASVQVDVLSLCNAGIQKHKIALSH